MVNYVTFIVVTILTFAFQLILIEMKSKIYLTAFVLMLSVITIGTNASTHSQMQATASGITQEQKNMRMEQIKERVAEIKQMDKSKLSRGRP